MQEQQTRDRRWWWLGLGGAALLAVLSRGWHLRQGPTAAQFFELATQARSAGKLTDAVIQYKSGLQHAPDDLSARRALGQTYLALHQPAAALTELERASGLAASEPAVQLDLAEAQLALGKGHEAQATLDSYRGPRTAEVSALEIKVKLALGDASGASKLLAEARAKTPETASLELATARLALSQRDLPGARSAVERALKLAPENVDGVILQGRIARFDHQPAAAVSSFLAATTRAPQDAEALAGLVDARIATGDLSGAASALVAFRKLAPGSLQALLLTGSLAYAREEWTEAAAALGKFVQQEPRQPQVLLMLAGSYFRLNQLNQAETVLKKLAPLQATGQTSGQRLQAVILLKQHRAAEAVQLLRSLVAGDTVDPGLLALLAQAYAASGNKTEARRLVQQAQAAVPEADSALKTQLAIAQISSGDAAQSLSALQQVVASAPDNLAARQALTYGQLAQGDTQAAIEAARLLVEMAPMAPLSHNLAGLAYAKAGDTGKAAAAFDRAVALDPAFAPAIANQGFLALTAGRTEDAKSRLLAALQAEPGYTPASLALATLAERAGDSTQAVSLLSEALNQHPEAVAARWQLAVNQLRLGQTATALASAAEAYRKEPETPASRLRLGEFQLRAGAATSAFETLRSLPAALVADLPAGFLLAEAARLSRHDAEARSQYRALLERRPEARAVWWGWFATELAARDFKAAAALIVRLRQQPTATLDADRASGELASAQGQWPEARSAFAKVFAADPSSPNLLRLVDAERAAGEGEAASQRLTEWLSAHPDDVAVRLLQGALALDAGQWAAAQAAFEALLALKPEHPIALNNLAWLYDRQNDPRALDLATRARQALPDSPASADTLGWILVRHQRVQQGLVLLETAHGQRPEDPDIAYHYAYALAEAGHKDKARSTIEALLARHKSFSAKEESRTLLLTLSGKAGTAAEAMN